MLHNYNTSIPWLSQIKIWVKSGKILKVAKNWFLKKKLPTIQFLTFLENNKLWKNWSITWGSPRPITNARGNSLWFDHIWKLSRRYTEMRTRRLFSITCNMHRYIENILKLFFVIKSSIFDESSQKAQAVCRTSRGCFLWNMKRIGAKL